MAGVHELDAMTTLTAQVSSLTNMIKSISIPTETQSLQPIQVACVYFGEEYLYTNCFVNPESANFVGNYNKSNNNNPYSNTYNLGWKQHANFSWG